MATDTVNPTPMTRRTFARSTAWAVPAVSVAAATPALASSGTTIRNAGYVSSVWNTDTCDGTTVTVDGTPTAATTNPGYTVQNSTTATKISNITLTFYLPLAGLTFTRMSGSASGWSNLTANGSSQNINGVTYYGYSSTYAGAVTAKSPNTTVNYGWTSGCSDDSLDSNYFLANSTATVDGKTVTTASGLATMN